MPDKDLILSWHSLIIHDDRNFAKRAFYRFFMFASNFKLKYTLQYYGKYATMRKIYWKR